MTLKKIIFKTLLLSAALINQSCSTSNAENLTKPPKGYEAKIDRAAMVKRSNDNFPLSDQMNKGGWKIDSQFSDEFETDHVNETRWYPNNPGWKGRQPTYFHGSNVSFDNGELVMKINQHGDEILPEGYTHSAAFIKSKQTVLYGYFESEAKLMDAPWVSGFWLTNVDKEWWTEIDIAENCPCVDSNRHDINSNVHVFRSPPEHGDVKKHFSSSKKYYHPDEIQKGYHVWGLEWNKDVIRFFIDGVMFREIENTHWHQPLEINVNNESNKWFKALPDDNRLDEEYRIKYVRVWRQQ
jgi:beta-glucanase (GH16 family)